MFADIKMNVLAINCSPREGGNTEILLKEVLKPIEERGIETMLFQLGGKEVNGCQACLSCRSHPDGKCHRHNPAINECIQKMLKADAIIIGSPTYFSDLSTEAKALIDVAGYVTGGMGASLKHKIGAAVVAVRRAGGIAAFDSINHFFMIKEMIVPGSSYWNIGFGRDKGEVLNDAEGLKTMKTLGENIVWLLQKVAKEVS